MSARDELRKVIVDHSMRSWSSTRPQDERVECWCGWTGGDILGHLLDQILARYAVVELPEADYHGCWPAGGRARVTLTSEGRITDGYAIRETAQEARALAVALLAAANRAEAQA